MKSLKDEALQLVGLILQTDLYQKREDIRSVVDNILALIILNENRCVKDEMRKYTDKLLENDNWIIKKIADEATAQVNKWGIQTRSAFEWLTYTTEELGSLAKAIGEHEYRGGSKERVVKEAVQVATLALKIAEMFEHSN